MTRQVDLHLAGDNTEHEVTNIILLRSQVSRKKDNKLRNGAALESGGGGQEMSDNNFLQIVGGHICKISKKNPALVNDILGELTTKSGSRFLTRLRGRNLTTQD